MNIKLLEEGRYTEVFSIRSSVMFVKNISYGLMRVNVRPQWVE